MYLELPWMFADLSSRAARDLIIHVVKSGSRSTMKAKHEAQRTEMEKNNSSLEICVLRVCSHRLFLSFCNKAALTE
jgi:hypothetical protein